MKLDMVESQKLSQTMTCGYSNNSARRPELFEYPHAIVCDDFCNATLSNFIKILIGGVPKLCIKYGMWVLKQLRATSTLQKCWFWMAMNNFLPARS